MSPSKSVGDVDGTANRLVASVRTTSTTKVVVFFLSSCSTGDAVRVVHALLEIAAIVYRVIEVGRFFHCGEDQSDFGAFEI